jgi:hypothetical protein
MGNDMFNNEQLAYARTRLVQYDPACVDCRHDAGKDAPDTTWQCSAHVRAERDFLRSKLATKWTIEERYEAACGDRDGLSRMVETLREQLARTVSERDSWHAEVEGWHETSARLRERLDQFEAYAITVKSALDDRARAARYEAALRRVADEGCYGDVKCSEANVPTEDLCAARIARAAEREKEGDHGK